jgi:RNA polymerase sigma-70 factor (ECF subfamily)
MSRLRTSRFSRPLEVQQADQGGDNGERTASEPADWSALADDGVLRSEMRERLIQALRHLPEVYRIPVILRDIQGLSTEEASAVLKVKPQTLKSRLHRGRLILREHLADFAGALTLLEREIN